MLPPDPRGADGPPPAWLAALSEFLRAWSMVERYGVEGWLRLVGSREPDPGFADALEVFTSELERLRAETDAEEARRRRAEVEAAKARRGA